MRRSANHPPSGPLVSIITPSIPARAHLLAECEASVRSQLVACWEHLVEVDEDGEGCATVINRLAAAAQGDWLMPLADDDLILPGCLTALLDAAHSADVIVYAPPLVTGNEDRWWFYQSPPAIPSTALIHRALWEQLGGYDESLTREEDRDLWLKATAAGATFISVDAPCWVYRQHAGNKSFQTASR